eukprot:988457-Amphidinium_carterae.1
MALADIVCGDCFRTCRMLMSRPFALTFEHLLWGVIALSTAMGWLVSQQVHQFHTLHGGGPHSSLAAAQRKLSTTLPTHLRLCTVPGDGNCFYHCLLTASSDQHGSGRRDTSAWTIPGLRGIAGNAE